MALLPAVSSCHSPARLEGKNWKIYSVVSSQNPRGLNIEIILYLFTLLCLCSCLFEFDYCDWSRKKKNPRRLDGCLLASMFVCLQIVNNKLSPPSLSMIGPWGMWPHLWEKIIRTAVQSGWESPSVCFQKQHCTKTVLCSWCYPRLDIYVSASAQ